MKLSNPPTQEEINFILHRRRHAALQAKRKGLHATLPELTEQELRESIERGFRILQPTK